MKKFYRILFALMVFAWGIPSTTHANIWGYVTMNVGDTKRLNASESTISTLRMIGEYNIESYEWYSDDWACVQVTGYEWWCCDIKALRPCEGVEVTFKCKYRGAGGWTESMTHCYVIDVREPEPEPEPGTWSGSTLTIGGSATGSSNVVPYNNYYRYSTTQMLYTPGEIGKSGKISGIAFKVANSTSFATSEVKVYLGHKSGKFSSESDYVSSSGLTLVYSGTPTLGQSSGWEPLTFNQGTFTYNGRDNLVVVVTKKASGYTQSLTYSTYTGSGYTLYRRNDDTSDYANASNTSYSYTASTDRPAVRLEFGQSPSNSIIQFADAKVKELCVANWDTNGDGELSKAEAAAVTDLGEVFRENTEITSFNELQYFTGLTSIGVGAFISCSGLTSVTIPSSVTGIGAWAFSDCSSLTSITIPNSVKSIENQAFYGCSSLTSIIIPNSVTSIGVAIFADCSSLASIKVNSGNTRYDSRDNCNAIIEKASNTLIAGCMNTIIPESVTVIGRGAFMGSGLTSVTIPESVTSIDEDAFDGCSDLISITIPTSVTHIGGWAFCACSSLTSVTIPDGLTYIADHAFYHCSSLTSVTIPESVTDIRFDAFNGCSSLTSITIPESVTSIGAGAFSF